MKISQNFVAFSEYMNFTVIPLSMFSIDQPINPNFYKKTKPLIIQIPNIYLGLGFEFGPQRIRDLAIVCS